MMKKLTLTIYLTIAVLLGSAGVSWGGDYEKGLTAYESGDYVTALREWTPLALDGQRWSDKCPEGGYAPLDAVYYLI